MEKNNYSDALGSFIKSLNELKKCEKERQFPLILQIMQSSLEVYKITNDQDKAEEIAHERVELAKDYYGINKMETILMQLDHTEL